MVPCGPVCSEKIPPAGDGQFFSQPYIRDVLRSAISTRRPHRGLFIQHSENPGKTHHETQIPFSHSRGDSDSSWALDCPPSNPPRSTGTFQPQTNLTAGAGAWGTDAFWATSSAPLLVAPPAHGPMVATRSSKPRGPNTVSIAAGGVSANSVTQTTNSTATTISSGGGTLSITGTGGIVNSGNAAFTINSPVNLNGAGTYTFQTTSSITVGGAIGETGTSRQSRRRPVPAC